MRKVYVSRERANVSLVVSDRNRGNGFALVGLLIRLRYIEAFQAIAGRCTGDSHRNGYSEHGYIHISVTIYTAATRWRFNHW